jgi:hypothetical protein
MLMIGFIYVAPLAATPATTEVTKAIGHASIRVDASPWANVFVDGKHIGTTPMNDKLDLVEGTHTVRFEHDWFQPVERQVTVDAKTTAPQLVRVDFCAEHLPAKPGKTPGCP